MNPTKKEQADPTSIRVHKIKNKLKSQLQCRTKQFYSMNPDLRDFIDNVEPKQFYSMRPNLRDFINTVTVILNNNS